MVEQVKDVPAYIREMYKNNCFMNEFGVEIGEITCGSAVVSIKLNPEKHQEDLPLQRRRRKEEEKEEGRA